MENIAFEPEISKSLVRGYVAVVEDLEKERIGKKG